MTKNHRSLSTTSTHTKAPVRQTPKHASKKKPKVTTRTGSATHSRSHRQATQEQIGRMFAAVRARKEIDKYFLGDPPDHTSPDHTLPQYRACLRFHADYFGRRGVVFDGDGQVTFPAQACGSPDLERLTRDVYLMVHDFLSELGDSEGLDLLDGYLDDFIEVGWRQGFVSTTEPGRPEHPIVPLILGLNVEAMSVGLNDRADRERVEPQVWMSDLERAFAAQLPDMWRKWKARRTAIPRA